MRNQPKPLDRLDATRQLDNARVLQRAMADSRPVTVTYSKRDGSESRSTGEVTFFNGRIGFDTGSVTIATADKGNRTINLHRIHDIG